MAKGKVIGYAIRGAGGRITVKEFADMRKSKKRRKGKKRATKAQLRALRKARMAMCGIRRRKGKKRATKAQLRALRKARMARMKKRTQRAYGSFGGPRGIRW